MKIQHDLKPANPHKINTILCDLDGVVADFFNGAEKLFKRPGLVANWPGGIYDMEIVMDMPKSKFWKTIERTKGKFWERLELLPGSDKLWRRINSLATYTFIATSPGKDPYAPSAKTRWVRKWLKDKRFSDIMIGHDKYLLAKPTVLLIDDAEHNIRQFIAAGGAGLLYPRPWNKLYNISNPHKWIMRQLKAFEENGMFEAKGERLLT